MLTRNQQYAQDIFRKVSEIAPSKKEYKEKYGAMAHKLPVLIRSAGLAQALAFVDSRGTEEQKKLLEHIALVVNAQSAQALLDRSRKTGLIDYMHLTRNVLAALVWFKRFAQSVLDVKAGDEAEGDVRE